ncbi:MAG: hypothetical protein L3J74_03380 [Bacteroidales bacterium]|nr:hypothetical protein [Bacteroidales bacterium]
MGWNIFKSSNKDEEKSLIQKIDNSLQKTKREKRLVEKEIEEIKDWAANAIIDAYSDFFPNSELTYYRKKYAETALEEYEKIKAKFGSQMDEIEVKKCDDIVKSYLEQIHIREEKLKLYENLEKEYKESKEKLKQAKFQEIENEKNRTKEERLQAHAQKLKLLEEKSNKKISEIEKESYELEDIKQDVVYHEEYHKELNRLNKQFQKDKNVFEKDIFEFDDENTSSENEENKPSSSFKDEIDDILNSIDDK